MVSAYSNRHFYEEIASEGRLSYRMLRIALLTLAFFGSCFAQVAAPKARVDGRVTNQSGQPLSNATIALVGNDRTQAAALPPAYNTTSDAAGGFSIDEVEPNTYRLFVQRTGYLQFVFAQPDGKVVMPIALGEHKSIEIKMTAQSFISGRITTENGEPFPNARVTVFRVTRANGKQQLSALGPVPAGADGSFSIGNLTAGRYCLAASEPPSLTQTNQREVRSGGSDQRYVTTYYPAEVNASTATVIEVPSGTEIRNLDIRLRKTQVFHLYGRVVDTSGARYMPSASINLLHAGVRDQLGNRDRISAVNGTFAFNGLLPGVYTLQARSATRELQGSQTVTLTDRDLDDVIVSLTPSLEIPLSVRIEDADPQQSQKITSGLGRFTLTASDGVNDNAMAQSNDDGTWMFRNIGRGTYRMGLGGPDGTYVKSIRFDNQDITRGELDTTSHGGALEMVLSPHAAEVDGVVRNAAGQPLAGVTVTLWMPGLPSAGTLDPARSTGTDALGHFRFGSLRPGEYRVAAWEKIEAGIGNISEFHARFDDRATTIKLREDSHETVQPVLIDRDQVNTEAAKLQ
jgi:Carboxypeptidase regulatory-like domain